MTRNLYLGAGLDDIIAALETNDPGKIVGAATTTWATVQQSRPAERMSAIADEIVAANPDVVGLQEVTLWLTYAYNPATRQTVGNPAVAYDFLDLLLDELEERGVTYYEVPGATADNFTSPPIPIMTSASALYPTGAVQLLDRDVILARDDVEARHGVNGDFDTILEPPYAPLEVARGWGSADIETDAATFRFVNAHTEAWGPEAIRIGQVMELFGAQEAVAQQHGALPMVYVGDYNTAAPDDGAYTVLTSQLEDAVRGNSAAGGATCCQNETLTNTQSELEKRIDLVLTSDDITATRVQLTGDKRVELPGDAQWASDHAGVAARLLFDLHDH